MFDPLSIWVTGKPETFRRKMEKELNKSTFGRKVLKEANLTDNFVTNLWNGRPYDAYMQLISQSMGEDKNYIERKLAGTKKGQFINNIGIGFNIMGETIGGIPGALAAVGSGGTSLVLNVAVGVGMQISEGVITKGESLKDKIAIADVLAEERIKYEAKKKEYEIVFRELAKKGLERFFNKETGKFDEKGLNKYYEDQGKKGVNVGDLLVVDPTQVDQKQILKEAYQSLGIYNANTFDEEFQKFEASQKAAGEKDGGDNETGEDGEDEEEGKEFRDEETKLHPGIGSSFNFYEEKEEPLYINVDGEALWY